MSIEIQCMTEKVIVITIELDYSKVPSKSTVPTYVYIHKIKLFNKKKFINDVSELLLILLSTA